MPKPKNLSNAHAEKTELHPRNPHRGRYDFDQLRKTWPDLSPFVKVNDYGDESINFADLKAVKTLNQALLAHFYRVMRWDIPPGYLCPPIPGRADYIHNAADILASCNDGEIPKGSNIRVLDIGVGANCIYPIIGTREYGWRFLGSDIDPIALNCAKRIISSNHGLGETIQIRNQEKPFQILKDLLQVGEVFDLCICNPPFYASSFEAEESSRRKWRNLGKTTLGEPLRNFGGQGGELWCEGGESAFICQIVKESAFIPSKCLFFTVLVSKETTLPSVQRALKKAGVVEVRVIPMAQGNKKSRIIAWTYLDTNQQKAWRTRKW